MKDRKKKHTIHETLRDVYSVSAFTADPLLHLTFIAQKEMMVQGSDIAHVGVVLWGSLLTRAGSVSVLCADHGWERRERPGPDPVRPPTVLPDHPRRVRALRRPLHQGVLQQDLLRLPAQEEAQEKEFTLAQCDSAAARAERGRRGRGERR